MPKSLLIDPKLDRAHNRALERCSERRVQHAFKQLQHSPIDVSEWRADEDFGVFPLGAKPKRLLICPLDCPEAALIPGHRYFFKIAHSWRAQQMWSELIAYWLSTNVGLQVPPCFIAKHSGTGDEGVLVESFLRLPTDDNPTRLFYHASDLLYGAERSLEVKDVPQTLCRNLRICLKLVGPSACVWWAHVIAFDAIIGNGDRHTENWGFLYRRTGNEGSKITLAPVFDNGTSLGYERIDAKLRKRR